MNGAANRFFVDTNVLIYWLDPKDPKKQSAARRWLDALWQDGSGRLSWQVLNEFYFKMTGKLRADRNEMQRIVENYVHWQPIGFQLAMVRRAWHWCDESQISYWDALIVAAAETTGCAYLLTEDLQNGYQFGEMRVVNPFLSDPAEYGLG